jgi:hypothetical protein
MSSTTLKILLIRGGATTSTSNQGVYEWPGYQAAACHAQQPDRWSCMVCVGRDISAQRQNRVFVARFGAYQMSLAGIDVLTPLRRVA